MWLRAAVVGKERQKKKKKQRQSFSVSKCVVLLSIFGLFWFLRTGCRVRWHRIKKSCCPYQPTKVRETFAFLHVLFRRDLALNITSKSLKWRQQLSVGDFTCSSFILERLAVSVCAPYKVVDARISFFFFLPKINGGGSVPVSPGKRMFPWKLPKTLAAEEREMRVLFLSLSLSLHFFWGGVGLSGHLMKVQINRLVRNIKQPLTCSAAAWKACTFFFESTARRHPRTVEF